MYQSMGNCTALPGKRRGFYRRGRYDYSQPHQKAVIEIWPYISYFKEIRVRMSGENHTMFHILTEIIRFG